jgi:hypothetical protein
MRSNSGNEILCTILSTPDLYHVDLVTGSAKLLHSFPSILGVLGIAEIGHDIFYVAGGNFSLTTFQSTLGSYAVWKVDLRGFDEYGVAGVKVSKLVDIKEAAFLNGATRLDAASKTLLIADSLLGGVWEVDVETGRYKLGVQIPELARPGAAQQPPGVNGIKVHDGYLYFTNTGKETLGRVPVNTVSGAVMGPAEVLVSGIRPDDFTIGKGGLAWITQPLKNTLSVLLKNGTVVDVLGSMNELTIAGPTACLFGKKDQLYCTTMGGLASQVNGTFTGGRIMEIDTESFGL